jgi:hypothetical protein
MEKCIVAWKRGLQHEAIIIKMTNASLVVQKSGLSGKAVGHGAACVDARRLADARDRPP